MFPCPSRVTPIVASQAMRLTNRGILINLIDKALTSRGTLINDTGGVLTNDGTLVSSPER